MATAITQPSPAAINQGLAGTITVSVSAGGAITGASIAIPLVATGGTGPYVWELLAGRVPPGLSFYSDGSIRGIPQSRGTALLLVRATDSASPASFADAWLTVVIN